MSDNDLIRRGDARDILSEEGWLGRSFERLAALPAVTQPAPDATAIREDSPNHAYRVGYAAGRAAALREAAATVQAGDTVQNIQRRILALIDKR